MDTDTITKPHERLADLLTSEMDAVNTLVVAGMIVLGIVYNQVIFVDVAIVYALLSFVGTLYIARQLGGDL